MISPCDWKTSGHDLAAEYGPYPATHIGSLPRPHDLLDLTKAKHSGQSYDETELNAVLTRSVADCVSRQVDSGVDIVTDGEFSKPGFFTYVRERFDGFESRPNEKLVDQI